MASGLLFCVFVIALVLNSTSSTPCSCTSCPVQLPVVFCPTDAGLGLPKNLTEPLGFCGRWSKKPQNETFTVGVKLKLTGCFSTEHLGEWECPQPNNKALAPLTVILTAHGFSENPLALKYNPISAGTHTSVSCRAASAIVLILKLCKQYGFTLYRIWNENVLRRNC